MVSEDLILKVKADMSQLNKDIKSATKDKLNIGVDSIPKSMGGGVSPTGGAGGGLSNAMEGAMSPMLKALAPLAILGTIASSSGALIATFKQLFRVVQMIVKPIGDIFSVGLMPIIQILKPIGKLFGAMMKPYMMKAREAMRAGGKFLKEGEYGEAGKAYMLGFSYMMKPFFDLMTKSMGEIAKAPLRIMDLFGQALVALGEEIPFVGDAFKAMGYSLSGASTDMMSGVDSATDAIIKFTNDALDRQLGGMLIRLGVKTGETTGDIVKRFTDMGLDTTALVGGMESQFYTFKISGLQEIKGFTDGALSYLSHLNSQASNLKKNQEVTMAPDWWQEKYAHTPSKQKVENQKELENLIGSIGNRDWKEVARSMGYYQTGTKFVPETGLYTLHRGEQVVSNTEKRRGGSVSFGDINITISGGRGLDENEIASKVKEEIFNELDLRVGG